MAAVNTSSIRERLQALLPRLREADAQLDAMLERVEDLFETELPEGSYGCILLKRPGRASSWWVHAVYRDGVFWLDMWKNDRHNHHEDLLKTDVREYKLLFCSKLRDVWLACGGDPSRLSPPGHIPDTAPRRRMVTVETRRWPRRDE